MTRPKLLDMTPPEYTREAREAGVKGLFLAKCVITTAGSLQGCRVVKGLPHMDQAVLSALARWRYTPVIYQGRPVAVDYVIQVRLTGP
jgi:TonB family protein